MTIRDCEEALTTVETIRKYKGALDNLGSKLMYKIEPINTGYGTEAITLYIPKDIVIEKIKDIIQTHIIRLNNLGIQLEEESHE